MKKFLDILDYWILIFSVNDFNGIILFIYFIVELDVYLSYVILIVGLLYVFYVVIILIDGL